MSLGLDFSDKPYVDIKAVSAAALHRLPELLQDWLPGGRREGREYVARNPTRADNKPGSFKVNTSTGAWSDFATDDAGGDAVSLRAYLSGKTQVDAAREVADRIGMTETVATAKVRPEEPRRDDEWRPIVPVPADAPKISDAFVRQFTPAGMNLVKGYRYELGGDRLVGHIARFEAPKDGTGGKVFLPFSFCEGGDGQREWRCKGFPEPRPLYGLHILAAKPKDSVIVVEGEKSAEAAYERFKSHVTVTSPNGSKSAGRADWSPLAGRDVVIWPDADAPGAKYAADVAHALQKVGAKSIGIVKLPEGLPDGWDLADDLPEGLTAEDLHRLLAEAKPVDDFETAGTAAASDGPLPLFPELPPAEPYPVEALGPVLSRAAAAISRKIQAPAAIAAQSVLAAAAIAAQAHADVRLPYGQTRPLSLFLVTVAKSGDRKSSADNEASWPLTRREKTMRDENVEAMKAWRIEQGAWAAQKKKIEADGKLDLCTRKDKLVEIGEEPPRPLAPFLTSGDLTIEGLTKNWPFAHAALGIFTAEAGQFTGGHGMSDDARLRTAAMLSEIWDGKPVKRVRAMDGVSILPGRRLSMHLLVQPDAAAGFLANTTLRDQGLLSRMLVAAPDSMAGTRLYRETDPRDDVAIHAYGARILSILEATLPLVDGTQNELDPRELPLSADAAAAWRQFYDHIERQCGADLKPVVDFAAKAAEHAARIAGVLTIVDDLQANQIGADAIKGALILADWYVNEALRLHAGARMDPKLLRAAAMLDWLNSRPEKEVRFSDILQFGPSQMRTKQVAEEAVDILLKHGWLVETSIRPRQFLIVKLKVG